MRRLALALALLLTPAPVPAQTDDRGIIQAFLEDNLSSAGRAVRIEGFAGALSSRATIERLTIADARGVWITLSDVVLDWNRSALLSGRLEVNELAAAAIVIDRPPEPEPAALPLPEAPGFALPELPVSVRIGRLSAPRIVLGPAVLGQPVNGALQGSLALAGGEGQAALRLDRLDPGQRGQIALDAGFANASRQLVLSLTAAEDAGGLAVSLLGVPGAPAAELAVSGAGPLSAFAATLRLATDGVPRIEGRVTLADDGAGGTRFQGALGGDLAAVLLPEHAAFFGPSVALEVGGQRSADGTLDLSALSLTARSLALAGRLRLAPDGLPLAVDVTGRLADPAGGAVLLPVSAGRPLRLAGADLALRFDAARGEGFTAALGLTGLNHPDLAARDLRLQAQGSIARSPAGRRIAAVVTLAAEGLAPSDPGMAAALGQGLRGRAEVDWTAGAGTVALRDLSLAGADYALTGGGTVAGLGAGYRIAGTASLSAADLSRFAGLAGLPLAGAGRVAMTGGGSLLGGDFDLQLQAQTERLALGQPELDALLRGPATVALTARRDAAGTAFEALDLRAGGGRVTGAGRLATAGSRLSLQARLPDLAVLGTGYRGALDAALTVDGTAAAGRATLAGSGDNLASARLDLGRLLAGRSALDIALSWQGKRVTVSRAEAVNPQARLALSGTADPDGSDLSLDARLADLGALRPGLAGALSGTLRFTGTHEAGRLLLDGTGQGLALGQAEADRLLGGEARVAADLALTAGRIGIERADLTTPQVTLTARGAATADRRDVTVAGRLTNLALIVPAFPGPLTLNGSLRQGSAETALDLRLQGPGRIDARVAGTLSPAFDRAALTIRGTALAALVNPFLGQRSLGGALSFDLGLNGRPRLAALSGPVRLTDGRLADPGLRFSITGIEAVATLGGGAAQISARAALSSGGGLTAAGRVGLSAPYPADLALALQGAVLRDPMLYRTTADADLRLSGPLTGTPRLSGAVRLGETTLQVPSTDPGGAGLPGLRHLAEPPPVRATRERAGLLARAADGSGGAGTGGDVALDITVYAPNRVFLRGRGLDAELGGSVTLQGSAAAVQPIGGLALIRGRLDLLGKRLTLSRAGVDLQGDLVPTLDIAATAETEGFTTAVEITGRADDPRVRFTSSPELPEEEVLARLLFGQGLGNLSALQAARLATAVATLAGRGGEGIVGRLRRGFALDDLDIVTDAEGAATLRAGKYLTEKVYSDVEVDSEGQSRINLNLDLRPGLTVRGSAGGDGSTGIGLFLERDY
jgi:translocation and assembly module TamB